LTQNTLARFVWRVHTSSRAVHGDDMRAMALFFVVGAAIWLAGPVQAQTYDPSYPICMQTYGPFSGTNCRYTSMAACQFLAQGRAAQCLINPYYVPRGKPRH
jgi:Protein of unknown function (DUF3551)